MNKPDLSQGGICEKDFEIECALSSIKWYAKEHKLTSDQVKTIWHEGILACIDKGLIVFHGWKQEDLDKHEDA